MGEKAVAKRKLKLASIVSLVLARHASLFAWVMKSHMREKVEDIADVVRTMLSPVDAEYILSSRKAPAAILNKLRQGFQRLGAEGKLSLAEEMMLDRSIERLDDALMTCERIRASPIPPLYTSHTSRLLMFYLAFLPLALRDSQLSTFAATTVAAVVGYTMFGLDEISHLLEMPFKVMPLRQFSKFCMMDVADALLRQPASLEASLSQLGNRTLPNTGFHNQPPQPYW
jgi:predicted membrane chloride channel (bestrophin family)